VMHAFCTSSERESILKLFNLSLFPNSDHLSRSPTDHKTNLSQDMQGNQKSMLPIVLILYQSTINTPWTQKFTHQTLNSSKHFHFLLFFIFVFLAILGFQVSSWLVSSWL
jgi:hypothetical protein